MSYFFVIVAPRIWIFSFYPILGSTCLLFSLAAQIDRLVSVFYATSLAYSVWYTIPGIHIKSDLQQHGITYEELKKYWQITDPSLKQPLLNTRDILLFSAQHDQYVHLEDADRLWEVWGRPPRNIYRSGHAAIELFKKKIARETVSFLGEDKRGGGC